MVVINFQWASRDIYPGLMPDDPSPALVVNYSLVNLILYVSDCSPQRSSIDSLWQVSLQGENVCNLLLYRICNYIKLVNCQLALQVWVAHAKHRTLKFVMRLMC